MIPAAESHGFRAERVRVQPRAGEEIVVERLRATDAGDSFLPSSFAVDGDERMVLSTAAFAARLHDLRGTARPLLIFDQFEELSTLFEAAPQGGGRDEQLEAQQQIVRLIVDLLRDETMPLKLLLVFREDYLAKIKQLLAACPELVDQAVHLRPPATDALDEIIQGPFEKYPGHFERELSPELADRMREAIESRNASGGMSLSEVQIACLRLWESNNPEQLFEEKGVQGLLEDFLSESLNRFPAELRDPAVAVLSHMVTAAGTRNVVSAEGLVADVRGEEDIPEDRVREALTALERDTRLVRRERRRDIDLYELVSEFLLPWIRRRREERLANQAARKERQRQREARRRLAVIFAVILLLVVAAAVAIVANRNARVKAERERAERASALASVAVSESTVDPVSGVDLGTQAVKTQDTPATRSALRATVSADHLDAVLRGDTEPVHRASFSPDGKLVVTGSDDGTARIWNASTGKLLHVLPVLPPRGGKVLYARFSADGEHVVTADTAGAVRLWTRSGQPVRTLRRFHHLCYGPVLNADGSLVLTCSADDGRYSVRKTATRQPVGDVPPLDYLPKVAALSADGKRVLSATKHKEPVTIWNVVTHQRVRVLPVSGKGVTAASFSPHGDRVVIGTGLVATIWNLRTLRHVPLRGHTGKIESAAFSDDGRYVVTAAGDDTARIWDASTGNSVAILKGHGDIVLDASFSPDGRRVVTSSSDRTARVWDIRSVTGDIVLPTLGSRVYSAAFRPDGRRVVTAGSDGRARIWNARTGRLVRMLRSKKAVLAAAYLPDGTGVVTAGLAGVEIWRPGARQVVTRTPAGDVDVRADGTLLIADYDMSNVWVVQAGHERRRLDTQGVVSARFSADGRRIVTAGKKGVQIWNGTTLASAGHLKDAGGGIQFASFSPDGKLIATAGSDATARLWDAASGHEVRVLNGHGGVVRSAGFSPDGRSVVTASDDRTVRIWNTANGALEEIFADHTDIVWSAAFSHDGMRIVSASSDGTARIYRLTPVDELLRLAHDRLNASVTAEDEQSPGNRR